MPSHLWRISAVWKNRGSVAKGYQLPDFYSGVTGKSGRFSEGLLLRRSHLPAKDAHRCRRGREESLKTGPIGKWVERAGDECGHNDRGALDPSG